MSSELMKGNQALAEGAVRAGCRFYAGYPITPQTEILEWMSWRQEEVGGTFIQGESEIASMAMLFGAAGGGLRAMTSSSSCGFSLKQEGLSYTLGAGIPAVIVNVQRFGVGGSSITPGQDAYNQMTKGGAHGDYHLIVMTPNSVQENADFAYEAFDLAEKYSLPVMILSDAAVGQMVEPCVLPPMKEVSRNEASYIAKGAKTGEDNIIVTDTFFHDPPKYAVEFKAKQLQMMEDEQRYETYCTEDAEVVFVAYGISSRIAREAVDMGRAEGLKLGMIRPQRVWPFPRKAFRELGPQVHGLVTIEMNIFGQMREDVTTAVKSRIPVYSYASAKEVPVPEKAVQIAKDVLAGKLEEEEIL